MSSTDQGSNSTTTALENGGSAIPILDVSSWFTPEASADRAGESVAQALVEALTTLGFVILVNHGISPTSNTQEAFAMARAFFCSTDRGKMQCAYQSNAQSWLHCHGAGEILWYRISSQRNVRYWL
jgi:isopenicillin N synthase-like dioxygenase